MIKKLATLLIALLLAAPAMAGTVVSSATSLTLSAGVDYVKTTSSTGTWTMPAVAGNKDRTVTIDNRGSTTLTVQRAGSDNLYTTTTTTSTTIAAGSSTTFKCDGTYWIVRAGGGGTTLTDSASLAAALSDETGSGAAVFATAPTLVNPTTSGLTNNGGSTFSSGVSLNSSNPAINIIQTWNNAGASFTAFTENITNTNSAATSLLMDLQVGSVSKCEVAKSGRVLASGTGLLGGDNSGPAFSFLGAGGVGSNGSGFDWDTNRSAAAYVRATSIVLGFQNTGLSLLNSGAISWSTNSDALAAQDLFILRDAAGVLAQRNGANPQTSRVYNTYTDASNFERGTFSWSGNVLYVGTEKLGTGTGRKLSLYSANTMEFCTNNSTSAKWAIDTSGNLSGDTTNGGDLTVGPHGGNVH
jgi:hypothetical protein